MAPPPVIHLTQVTKSYKEGLSKRTIFHNTDASFGQGEFSVLLGRSGSGKTTLLNLISGIDLPDEGEITVGDTVINKISEHNRTLFRRQNIGFIFQFFNLIPQLTVEENIFLPLSLNGLTSDRNKVYRMIERIGLKGREKSFPDRLSGGEQQRVAVARALIHSPTLVLADEPTGNLDTETGGSILKLLTSLVREENKTLIVVTHSQEVARAADRIFQADHGKIKEVTL